MGANLFIEKLKKKKLRRKIGGRNAAYPIGNELMANETKKKPKDYCERERERKRNPLCESNRQPKGIPCPSAVFFTTSSSFALYSLLL